LYGIFTKDAIDNAKDEELDDYDLANILDYTDDMDVDPNHFGKDLKKEIQSINKWIKRFGVQKDFDSFEPDSKNQTYIKF